MNRPLLKCVYLAFQVFLLFIQQFAKNTKKLLPKHWTLQWCQLRHYCMEITLIFSFQSHTYFGFNFPFVRNTLHGSSWDSLTITIKKLKKSRESSVLILAWSLLCRRYTLRCMSQKCIIRVVCAKTPYAMGVVEVVVMGHPCNPLVPSIIQCETRPWGATMKKHPLHPCTWLVSHLAWDPLWCPHIKWTWWWAHQCHSHTCCHLPWDPWSHPHQVPWCPHLLPIIPMWEEVFHPHP